MISLLSFEDFTPVTSIQFRDAHAQLLLTCLAQLAFQVGGPVIRIL
jgi:hypothetical protein